MKRRTWLLSGVGAAGALVVGWACLPPRSRLGAPELLASSDPSPTQAVALNGWIRVRRDGGVQLAMPRSEMGQGVHTALALLVAEELDLPLARIELIAPGHDTLYGNVAVMLMSLPVHPDSTEPGHESKAVAAGRWMVSKIARELGINMTGGSTSVADAWEPMRWAAASARAQLVGAAASRWQRPPQECVVDNGVVRHASLGLSAHFGELAADAARATQAVAGEVHLKPTTAWRQIGRPAHRLDAAVKSDGRAVFGQDVRLPNMVYAAVRHSPALAGALPALDEAQVRQQPGVLDVVPLPTVAGSTPAWAVVSDRAWTALQTAASLKLQEAGPGSSVNTATVQAALAQATQGDDGFVFHDKGDAPAALAQSPRKLQAVYQAPYLAHAAMEPMNCTVQISSGKLEMWVPTQVPGLARQLAARLAGVPESAVTVHVTYLGGGFGRRLDLDFVGQAVQVALKTSPRPVQLLWSRQEDMTHDFYRPAGAARLQGALNDRGDLVALAVHSAGDAITPRHMARAIPQLAGPLDLPDKTTAEGLYDLPYEVPHQRMAHTATHSGVPVGYWRSVGHSHNAFFSESFMDELAHAAGADPVDFRLKLLQHHPRHATVLRLAATKAGWGQPLPTGVARGVALHESFGTVVAQVLELEKVGDQPRVRRVVCAVDCGVAVNPDGVAQQMESSVVFGLTAALYGRIDIVGGVVQQHNFHHYEMLRLAQTPAIETHIVPSDRAPTGMGEPGTPPVAPALANAWFVLTGQRLRQLPLTLQ